MSTALAQALGNAVTADPPGVMAIHYNPAGLSIIDEDVTCRLGLSAQSVSFKANYSANPAVCSGMGTDRDG